MAVASIAWAQIQFEENGQSYDTMIGRGVALGDFNGDGFDDAFLSSQSGFQVYFGDGVGGFTNSNQTLLAADNWWGTPVIADINQDGGMEVITGRTVWMHDSEGQFAANTELISLSADDKLGSVQLADLNKDGYQDLFAILNYAASRVFLNDGTGRFIDSGQKLGDGLIGNGQIADLTLGDINHDGSPDAVVTGWRWNGSTENPNQVWINNGSGQFTLSDMDLDEGASHVHGAAFCDLNKDGWQDLILAIQDTYRSGRIYFNDGAGTLVKGPQIGSRSGEDVELVDFNGDGIVDLLIAQSNQPSRIWLNDGEGNLTDSGIRLGNHCYWDAATGDLNQDGLPDIMAVGFNWLSSGLTAAPMQVWLNRTTHSAIETGTIQPSNIHLHQNYPNPFNPSTTIPYSLLDAGPVQLSVFNTQGQCLYLFKDRYSLPGNYYQVWDGKDHAGCEVPSGVYVIQLAVENHILQRKMLLVR